MYNFHHNNITNDQWYKKCCTQSDISNTIEVSRQHKVLLDQKAEEKHIDYFEIFTEEEKETVRLDAEEL